MSKTPKTDSASREEHSPFNSGFGAMVVPTEVSRALESAGNALHERLEHWISMNSGICDPKDVEAIEAWKEATK